MLGVVFVASRSGAGPSVLASVLGGAAFSKLVPPLVRDMLDRCASRRATP
ncbi:hypothetical protein [Sorangium sp. So ce1389]